MITKKKRKMIAKTRGEGGGEAGFPLSPPLAT